MNNIDLKKISSLISKKLGRDVEIVEIEKAGSGYHSDGFRLISKDGTDFFLKKVKSHDVGFELPERKVMSLLVSNGMHRRANISGTNMGPGPIGVIIDNGHEAQMIHDIDENTAIYHVQEYEADGVSYSTLLRDKKNKVNVDEADLAELEKVTDYINKIHAIKHPSGDVARRKSVYNDSLRNILTNPELTVMLLHSYPHSHPILPPKDHGAYVSLMLDLTHKWKDRHDRLSALHGDFWGANLFFKKNGEIWVIDHSRIPWGDPGVDIGWWLSQYLWLYHETKNPYFKKLGEKFLDMYAEKSGDKEIRQAVSLVLGLICVIYFSFKDLDEKVGKTFFDNILQILRGNELVWHPLD